MEPELSYLSNIFKYVSSSEIDTQPILDLDLNLDLDIDTDGDTIDDGFDVKLINYNNSLILEQIKRNPTYYSGLCSSQEVITIATVLLTYPHLIGPIETYVRSETNKSKTMNLKIKKRKSKKKVPLKEQDKEYKIKRAQNTEAARRCRSRQKEAVCAREFINNKKKVVN